MSILDAPNILPADGRVLIMTEAVPSIAIDGDLVVPPIPIVPSPIGLKDDGPGTEGKAGGGITPARRWTEIIRRIIGIGPRSISDARIIIRHIDDIGLGGLDHYGAVTLFDRKLGR